MKSPKNPKNRQNLEPSERSERVRILSIIFKYNYILGTRPVNVQWNLDIVDILGGTLLYTISSFSTIQVQSIKQSMKSVTEKSTLQWSLILSAQCVQEKCG